MNIKRSGFYPAAQLGTGVLQHPVEDATGGGVGVVAGVRLCMVVGAVEDHVGMVRLSAAGHGDVEVLPRACWFDQDVSGVGGDALGSMGGHCVAEVP